MLLRESTLNKDIPNGQISSARISTLNLSFSTGQDLRNVVKSG